MNRLQQRTRQRLTAWVTALVILLGALAPLISHAGHYLSGDDSWLEICTFNGLERIAIESDPSDGGSGAGAQSCPWCNLQSGAWGLPSPDVVLATPRADDTFRFTPSPQLLRPRLAWSAAQARAPPLSA